MVLSICGNFDREQVLSICDKILKEGKNVVVTNAEVIEPETVVSNYVEQKLPVSIDMFDIGFKELPMTKDKLKKTVQLDIILEELVGETSEFYETLYSQGLINASFGYEIFYGDDYLTIIIGGESVEPKKVYDMIIERIETLKKSGLDEKAFNNVKKASYGERLRGYENPGNICGAMVNGHFVDTDIFEAIEIFREVDFASTNQLLQTILNPEKSVLSVIKAGE